MGQNVYSQTLEKCYPKTKRKICNLSISFVTINIVHLDRFRLI